MLNSLLAPEFVNSLGVFALGVGMVFLGLTVLVLIVTLQKYVFRGIDRLSNKKKSGQTSIKDIRPLEAIEDSGEIPLDIRLAIVAAVSACYESEQEVTATEFKVKRIKRI